MHLHNHPEMISKDVTKKTLEQDINTKEMRPFESFQNCLFSVFTSCVPWSCMRRIYWRKDRKGDEVFQKTVRRNSRAKMRR